MIRGLVLGLAALLLHRPAVNVAIAGLGISMLFSMISSILMLNNNLKLGSVSQRLWTGLQNIPGNHAYK